MEHGMKMSTSISPLNRIPLDSAGNEGHRCCRSVLTVDRAHCNRSERHIQHLHSGQLRRMVSFTLAIHGMNAFSAV